MDAPGKQLLIISRDTLLDAERTSLGPRIFRLVASISRRGIHVLLTAPEPDHWIPTRGRVDKALADQGRLQRALHEAGGNLDGVYYVPKSLFTQDRNREAALQDIVARYELPIENALLISGSEPFLRAAERLALEIREIPSGPEGVSFLAAALAGLLEE